MGMSHRCWVTGATGRAGVDAAPRAQINGLENAPRDCGPRGPTTNSRLEWLLGPLVETTRCRD
eukprot:4927396-Pyramimonas_sp.AAC.1